MPDITLCTNNDCPMQKQCKRHQSQWEKLSNWQSMGFFEPVSEMECDYKIEIRNNITT